MAEAVGIVASIIAIVQIADRIGEICRHYIESSSDTPRDLRVILLETSTVKGVLENLRFLCNVDPAGTLAELNKPDGVIETCGACLESLLKLFPEQSQSTGSTKRQRLTAALAWPLRKPKADKLLDELARIKSTLTLFVLGDTARDLKDIKEAVQATRAKIDASELGRVLDWLQHTNPSRRHNIACDLHEEHTSDWLFRHPHWIDWLNRSLKQRLLWIHGIPGAGKTVLFSFLVQHLQRLAQQSSTSRDITVFYYCYFGHDQDESVPLLRWVNSQLCRKAKFVSARTFELYETRQEPNQQQLLEELGVLLKSFDNVTLAIDALDESDSRRHLLATLKRLSTEESFENLRIVATSREYSDIETALSEVSTPIPMSNPYVEADIKHFVHSVLTTSQDFSCWPIDLREETEDALAKGAKGMFRWAVCQLDILRRLVTRDAISQALTQLPETLDETYERLFAAIPSQHCELVNTILLILCADNEWNDPDYADLGSFIVVYLATQDTSRLVNPARTLKDLCGCLLSIGKHDAVYFAHYTVKEFITSERNSTDQLSWFRICEESISVRFIEFILQWILKARGNDSVPDDVDLFLNFTAMNAFRSQYPQEVIWQQKELSRAAFDVLSTWKTWQARDWSKGGGWNVLVGKDAPNGQVIFLNILREESFSATLMLRFLDQADLPSLWQSNYTFRSGAESGIVFLSLLEVLALALCDEDNLDSDRRILFRDIACMFDRCHGHLHDLVFGISSGRLLDWVKLENASCHSLTAAGLSDLLNRTADSCGHGLIDPNPPGFLKTPLQIATECSNIKAVCLLLGMGADPNRTGNPSGIHVENAISLYADRTPLEICRGLMTRSDTQTRQRLQTIEHLLLFAAPLCYEDEFPAHDSLYTRTGMFEVRAKEFKKELARDG